MPVFPSVSERKQINLLPISFHPKTPIRGSFLLNVSIITVSSLGSGLRTEAILSPTGNLAMSGDILVVTIGECF